MIRHAALLCLLLGASAFADAPAWDDPYYAVRIPLVIDAPAAGRYAVNLDAHRIAQWLSEIDRYGYKADWFGHDQVMLVEVQADGTTRTVDARFEMRLGEEMVRNGDFEQREDDRPAGWTYTRPYFELKANPGGGSYISTEGADRNACYQNLATERRTWYRFTCRMRGRGSCSPQAYRQDEGWQPLDGSWHDPYFDPADWRDASYFVYTGEKDLWQTDTVQMRVERYTGDIDDVNLRACDVSFVMHAAAPGEKRYLLYIAPQEGVTPSPPSTVVDDLPAQTIRALRRGAVERCREPVMYSLGVSDGNADVWYAASTCKVGPDDPAPKAARDRISLGMARNEAEPIQIVFRATSGGTIEKVELSLEGPGGAEIDERHIEVRRAHYVPIREPSRPDYTRTGRSRFTGRLPDPLPRFAPVSYRPGSENILLWLDVRVPADAPAGVYEGTVAIATTAGAYDLPVELTVWDFALPDRPTCRTSLQFSRYANQFLFPFHKVESVSDKYALSRQYIAEMARYRITAKAPAAAGVWNPDGPLHGDDLPSSLKRYDTELPWAFDQLHVTGFALGHVSGPSMPGQDEAARAKAAAYYEPRAQWLKDRGYLRRSFIQIDEPRPEHFGDLRRWIEAVRSTDAGRGVPMFTFVYNADCFHDLSDVIDIMVPINNDAASIVSPRAMSLAPPAQQTWFYYTRTAHMWIDAPGLDQRLWAPHVWAYGGKGLAVWGINQWWDDVDAGVHAQFNPWENPHTTWGNGALAYFYPPSPLGKDLPARDMTVVPSLRLLLTRDGIEDYEYGIILQDRIAAAKQIGHDTTDADAALAMLRRPFATPRSWTLADAHWHLARRRAAEAIVALRRAEP